jgi:group I intron endonuclease
MYIYKITNKLNGKIYIGKHASKRKNYWGSGKVIKLVIKKHGKENFVNEIIEFCNNEKELNECEIYWIKFFNATDKNIGYNITDGGDGNGNICKGYWLNKKLSDEHKKNISNNHADVCGEKNPMYNKKHTNEVKEKLRKFRTGRKSNNACKLKLSEKRKGEKNSNSKLTANIVLNIKNDYINNKLTMEQLGIKYGVKKSCIWKIIHNYTWKHLN